jgi:hypothetical protein
MARIAGRIRAPTLVGGELPTKLRDCTVDRRRAERKKEEIECKRKWIVVASWRVWLQ